MDLRILEIASHTENNKVLENYEIISNNRFWKYHLFAKFTCDLSSPNLCDFPPASTVPKMLL